MDTTEETDKKLLRTQRKAEKAKKKASGSSAKPQGPEKSTKPPKDRAEPFKAQASPSTRGPLLSRGDVNRPAVQKAPACPQKVVADELPAVENIHVAVEPIMTVSEPAIEVHGAFRNLKAYMTISCADSDELCLKLIDAFCLAVTDFKPPPQKVFLREFEATVIKPCLSFLSGGSSLPIAMGNLVKLLKHQLTTFPEGLDAENARQEILAFLTNFAEEKVTLARQAISLNASAKIDHGSVILAYSWSSLVEKILVDAKRSQKDFKLILVDNFPEQPAKAMLRRLVAENIPCTYVSLSGLHNVLSTVNVVLLGAEALLANGNVLTRQGSSLIVLGASHCNIPVLVVCPTYKFSDKVITGTFDTALKGPCHEHTEVTPADLVSGVVTELRIQACSAAPAVLRVKQQSSLTS